jgi:hypothetical protein
VRFGRPKSSPLIDPFYDGNWKAELGMTTKIVPGSLWRGSAPESAIFQQQNHVQRKWLTKNLLSQTASFSLTILNMAGCVQTTVL